MVVVVVIVGDDMVVVMCDVFDKRVDKWGKEESENERS